MWWEFDPLRADQHININMQITTIEWDSEESFEAVKPQLLAAIKDFDGLIDSFYKMPMKNGHIKINQGWTTVEHAQRWLDLVSQYNPVGMQIRDSGEMRFWLRRII